MTDMTPTDPPVVTETPAPETEQSVNLQETMDLAAELQKLNKQVQNYSGLVKGVVTAISGTGTLSVTISGDSTVVEGVGYMEHYGPTVGDVVIMEKQGPDFLIMGKLSTGGGWQNFTMAAGFTAPTFQYRIINDRGSGKVQLRGWVNRTSGLTVVSPMPAGTIPSVNRYLTATRGVDGVIATVSIIVNGALTLDAASYTIIGTTDAIDPIDTTTTSSRAISLNALTGFHDQGGADLDHNHWIDHTHGVTGAHSHSVNVTVNGPSWISFDGLEYWL